MVTNMMMRLLAGCALGLAVACSPGMEAGAGPTGTPFEAAPSPIGRCINLGGALEAPVEGSWGYTIRREDMARIKAAGFDTVRIPVKWSAHAMSQPPYTIDEPFLRRVDQVVIWALEAGLQVVVNVHHYDEINEDPDTHYPRLAAIWDQLSYFWEGAPPELMFEILNEPHSDMTLGRVNQMNREILAGIRQRHPDRWVILGGGHWGALTGLVDSDPPYDPKAMITFHYYEPFEFTHQGAHFTAKKYPTGTGWGTERERRAIARDMAEAAAFRDKAGMPLLLGEFGVFLEADVNERAEWTGYVREQAEANGFGWCYWEWGTGFPVYDLERERWIAPVRDALVPND